MQVIATGIMACSACGLKMDAAGQNKKNNNFPKFHKECISCKTCKVSLGDKKWCFLHKGVPYCDITCLQAKRHPKDSQCFTCKSQMSGDSRVIKLHGNIYHTTCLRCFDCAEIIHPGAQFRVKDKKIMCQKHVDSTKPNRSQIAELQRLSLVHYFKTCKYPTDAMRAEIARKLKLKPNVVKVWFQNWRARS